MRYGQPLSDLGYSAADRLLHRLALKYRPIAELSFDIDQSMMRGDTAATAAGQHVFVAGLARAGTTVLMRRFHATGQYRSLTYRDMPFVLAPRSWRRLSARAQRPIASAERAHGDAVEVDGDSPESLDEVFWRVFAGEYLHRDRLTPHVPDDGVVDRYIRYVSSILASVPPAKTRYLCKNNNNILRLGAIRRAFPQALILVPFRQPLNHAHSLLRLHHRFSRIQAESPFALSYMTWLGHHEFGLDHRPFRFDGAGPSPYDPNSLDYWLGLWCETYEALERSKPESALFVCYEDLCELPETWTRLARRADLAGGADSGAPFVSHNQPVGARYDAALADRAAAIYHRLLPQARAALA